MKHISKQIYHHLINSHSILIIPHQKPDGDALGSATALANFLSIQKKNFTIFCATNYPVNYRYLPLINQLTFDPTIWEEKHFDTIVVLDSGDLRHAGVEKYITQLKYQTTLINIDHHPTNENYGAHNLVCPQASSTAEIIYKFFKHNNVEVTKEIAFSLLTGMVSDTENFTNGATTTHSLQIASDLVRRGGDLSFIRNLLWHDKTINTLKLWGVALARLTRHEQHDIVFTYLTRTDLIDCGAKDSEAEGIANFLNNLNEGRAGLIVKEQPDGKSTASFRTTHDDFDVAAIAKSLGGGGHKKAAGFTMAGNAKETLEKIWEKLDV